MVLHFIIEKEHLCTKETLINRIQTAAKAQCTSKIKGALSLDIRSFYNMPIDLANSQDTAYICRKRLDTPGTHQHSSAKFAVYTRSTSCRYR